ncbi:MAG TPA: ABC transporter ATP-binding protein [Acidimicrobiales bacterium]|nr:ABC transporter ATP-binding protein [Acidimicrobiales bacterium]
MAERLRSVWYMTVLAFRADAPRATGALVAGALNAAGFPIGAYLTSRVITHVVALDGDGALRAVVLLAVVGIASMTASLVRLDLRFRMEESTALLIDRDLVALTTGMPGLEHHERPEHLDRMELLRAQRRMLSSSVAAIIENFGTVAAIVTTTSLLATIDARLLLLPAFGIPSVVASARTRRWFQQVEERTAERLRGAEHLYDLATTASPAKELRVFGLRPEIRRRYVELAAGIDAEHDRTMLRSTMASTAGWAVFAVGYVAAIAFVALEAVAGRAGAGDVILVVSLAGQVNGQVSSIYLMVGWLFDTLKTVGRYLALVDEAAATRPRIDDPAAAPDELSVGIELRGVSFRYPGTDTMVLEDLDLFLPARSTVAIVGDNGGGKSTLIKLLSRFYDPTEGAVLVDGVDLRRIPIDDWRARMAAGFQDFARLELLARETVGVGSLPSVDDLHAVAAALTRASADDIAGALPSGLETQVGRSFEGGMDLSGGQWQKLALGRAMMRETPLLLVLDEPTAALDADTEHALFARYAGAAHDLGHRTGGITVLVSHRFSTVGMADLILVVGARGILEQGTHDELMARGGTYAELFALQASAYQ